MYDTPDAAEAAFYHAFQSVDLEAMMQVWLQDDEVVCIHPMGPRLEGYAAVRSSWAQILAGGGDGLRFELSNVVRHDSQDLAVHFVFENISVGPSPAQRSVVSATNVYRLTDAGWLMSCHHGSPGRVGSMQIDAPSGPMH